VINAARATISLSHGLVEFLEQLLPVISTPSLHSWNEPAWVVVVNQELSRA
jgi:hypothetical protein